MNKKTIIYIFSIIGLILISIIIYFFINGNKNNSNIKIGNTQIEKENKKEVKNKKKIEKSIKGKIPIKEYINNIRAEYKNKNIIINNIKNAKYVKERRLVSDNSIISKNINTNKDSYIILNNGFIILEGINFLNKNNIGYIKGYIIYDKDFIIKDKNKIFDNKHKYTDILQVKSFYPKSVADGNMVLFIEFKDNFVKAIPLENLSEIGYSYDFENKKINIDYSFPKLINLNQKYIVFDDTSKKVYKNYIKDKFKNNIVYSNKDTLNKVYLDDNYFYVELKKNIKHLMIINKKRKKILIIDKEMEKGGVMKINIRLMAKILSIKNKDTLEFFSFDNILIENKKHSPIGVYKKEFKNKKSIDKKIIFHIGN